MSFTTMIKKGGFAINEDFILQVCAANPHCFGVAMADGDSVSVKRGNVELPPDKIKEFGEKMKSKELVFSLGDQKDIGVGEIQPYTLIEDQANDPQLVAFVHGDFSTFHADDGHSDVFHFVNEYLIPKIVKMHDGTDFEKLFNNIDDITCREIAGQCSNNHCQIILLAANGKLWMINRGQDGKAGDYDWGWTSNTHGFAPKVTTEKKPSVVQKTKDMFSELLGNGEEKKTASPPPATEPAKPATAPAPAPTTTPAADDGMIELVIPPGMNRKDRKKWLKDAVGDGNFPKRWDEIKSFSIHKSKVKIKDFQTLAAAMPTSTAIPASAGGHATLLDDPTPVPSKKGPPAEPIQPSSILKLSAEEKANVSSFLKDGPVIKEINRYAKLISDEHALHAAEKRRPSLHESTGIQSTDETFKWSDQIFDDFAKNNPKAIALLAISLRDSLRRMTSAYQGTLERITELEGQLESGHRTVLVPPKETLHMPNKAAAAEPQQPNVQPKPKTSGFGFDDIKIA